MPKEADLTNRRRLHFMVPTFTTTLGATGGADGHAKA